MGSLRQTATLKLRTWAARRHGLDGLPMTISRRRVYILPTRFGIMLALMLVAMLIAGLNYNSNLGLGFAFLMVSVALVIMHHCNRNLVGLGVDAAPEVDGVAGQETIFTFSLSNGSRVERRDVEIRCSGALGIRSVAARGSESMTVAVAFPQRGVFRVTQFELRTRYPFGWYHAWTYVQAPLTAYVAPAPRGHRKLTALSDRGDGSPAEVRGDEDFSDLRPYRPGIPLKHMAWKVLARGGEAAVRNYTGLAAEPHWLDWSSLEGLESESRLSQLCLWILQCATAQRPYGLRIPGCEIAPSFGSAHRMACLRALAIFGNEPP